MDCKARAHHIRSHFYNDGEGRGGFCRREPRTVIRMQGGELIIVVAHMSEGWLLVLCQVFARQGCSRVEALI